MTFLACCHTIVVDGDKYNASSPDELALVNFAKQMGYNFKDRDIQDNCVIEVSDQYGSVNKTLKYKLLNICEFNSTRKRMSCVFLTPENQYIVMTKGADSVIYDTCMSKASKESEVYNET